MTTKAGGLIRNCAPRQDVKNIRRHMYTRVLRETCLRETEKAPIKTGWAETDKGQLGKPNVRARWVAEADAREARVARANAATQGAESCVVGDRHGHAWRKSCGAGAREKSVLLRSSTKKGKRRITT